jgi:hypothetical protein
LTATLAPNSQQRTTSVSPHPGTAADVGHRDRDSGDRVPVIQPRATDDQRRDHRCRPPSSGWGIGEPAGQQHGSRPQHQHRCPTRSRPCDLRTENPVAGSARKEAAAQVVAELYAQGRSIHAIAREQGWRCGAISGMLHEHAVAARLRGRVAAPTAEPPSNRREDTHDGAPALAGHGAGITAGGIVASGAFTMSGRPAGNLSSPSQDACAGVNANDHDRCCREGTHRPRHPIRSRTPRHATQPGGEATSHHHPPRTSDWRSSPCLWPREDWAPSVIAATPAP